LGGLAIESEHVMQARRPRSRPLVRTIPGLWQCAPLRWFALAALLAVYAVLSLSPFDWRFPEHLANGAVQLADGWSFPSPGIVLVDPPGDGLEAALAETLDVRVEVRPFATRQLGPARILTISGAERRNLALAQSGNDLILWLRGGDIDGRRVLRLEDVFAAGEWVAIDVRLQPGLLTVVIDGREKLAAAMPTAVLGTWDPGFRLALGNARTCNNPWLGDLRKAVIAGPDSATDYALARQVELPAGCRILRHPPKLAPLVSLNRRDALLNTVMYLPLGCLLGLMVRRRNRRAFAGLVLAVAGVSLTFEALQLLVPSRFPSIDDVIFNTAGGAIGMWLALALLPRLTWWLHERRA
jgi:VanZ like family